MSFTKYILLLQVSGKVPENMYRTTLPNLLMESGKKRLQRSKKCVIRDTTHLSHTHLSKGYRIKDGVSQSVFGMHHAFYFSREGGLNVYLAVHTIVMASR